jgi:VWFA-related protein
MPVPQAFRRLFTTRPWAALACAALAGLAVHAAAPGGRQAAAQKQQPTFRTAANFVQVDAYPTAGGRPVGDLSKDDFEVLEDGVPQSVATFEHVAVRPAAVDTPRVEPRSTADEKNLVADPHNRLWVLFLDTYHVTDPTAWHNASMRMPGSTTDGRPREKKPLGPRGIDKAIVNFLERAVGPNDLVAAMSPEMDVRQMVFGRRPERFVDWVSTAWARRFSWDDLEPEEERWAVCYPPEDLIDPFGCYKGIFEEMVLRQHEMKTLQAIDDTVTRLGMLREGRKAVVLISEGWPMYRPDQRLARALPAVSKQGCPADAPQLPGVFVGPGGKLQTGSDPRNPQIADVHACDAARLRLALLDNESDYRRLLDRANRETVSFYPVDPRGLAVFDTPIDAVSPSGVRMGGAADEIGQVRGRLETLRNLASATDGFVSENNDLNASMKRIADDLSDYYLLGYNSTNSKLDGKFRKITVRVKRPGVQVRARRGYLAPTEAEMAASAAPPRPPDPAVRLREAALASLGSAPANRIVRLTGGYEWRTPSEGGGPAAPTLWAVAELGESAARQPEWREGGDAVIAVASADGSVVGSGRGRLSPASRAFAWSAAGLRLGAGEYLVAVTARAAPGSEGTGADRLKVVLPQASVASTKAPGTPRVFRRGPSTGTAYVQTADTNFRRVERLRVSVSLAEEPAGLSARLLDRSGNALGVPVTFDARAEDGRREAVADATLASLAPGDYLVELTLGDGAARQIIVLAFRIVP